MQFTDESTGNPATWIWDFGDGNTSTLENPTNTYVNDGTYSVTLTEGNSLGQNETTQAAYIVVGSSAPVAAFTASPVSGTLPLSVQFTDTSTNSPVSWIWDFGDGGTSTEENPSHIYSNPGTYTVSLTATNTVGENTVTGSETVITSDETVAVTDTNIKPDPNTGYRTARYLNHRARYVWFSPPYRDVQRRYPGFPGRILLGFRGRRNKH